MTAKTRITKALRRGAAKTDANLRAGHARLAATKKPLPVNRSISIGASKQRSRRVAP